jgi:hypothetical protein
MWNKSRRRKAEAEALFSPNKELVPIMAAPQADKRSADLGNNRGWTTTRPDLPGMSITGTPLAERDLRTHPGRGEWWNDQRTKISRVNLAEPETTPDEQSPKQPGAGKPKPKKTAKIYTWICGYCGEEFTTSIYAKRYCTPTHKKYAQRERKRRKL